MGAEYVIARFFKLLVNKMFSTNLEAHQSTEASNVLISYRCSHVTSEDYILQVGQLKAPGTEPCSHPVYINMANRRTTPSSNLDCYSTSIRFRIDKQISQAREFLWFEWWRLGHQIILKQGPRRGRPGGGLSPPLLGHLVQTFDFLYERTHSRRHNAHKNVTFKNSHYMHFQPFTNFSGERMPSYPPCSVAACTFASSHSPLTRTSERAQRPLKRDIVSYCWIERI